MNNIEIKTLSQVHIGNGNFLQVDNDFIVEGKGEDSSIVVFNINKLAKIIGTDAQSIQQWTDSIMSGDSYSFIRERIYNHPYQDYAKRCITNYASFQKTNGMLKECIHDGMGRPYIPGSSIKGAIRTAVFATMAKDEIVDALSNEHDKKERKRIMSGMERRLLGNSPESDIFRYFSTGDAYFDKGVEIAVKQVNLNTKKKGIQIDYSKQQVVEAISSDQTSSFRINANSTFYHQLGLRDLLDLFTLIREHTQHLVEEEIEYWDGDSESSEGYVYSMNEILDEINSCESNECVLRIGQASGWRFITGAWLEALGKKTFKEEIAPLCRYNNNTLYQQYDFPKSRRMDDESYLFGFVKLTIR